MHVASGEVSKWPVTVKIGSRCPRDTRRAAALRMLARPTGIAVLRTQNSRQAPRWLGRIVLVSAILATLKHTFA